MITKHQAKYFATELTMRHSGDGVDRISQSLFDASVDLNPHQINAALFVLKNPLSKGVVLADEVGLGKTIEAGLVLSQYWAERKQNILVICPASLRKQWAQELSEKFNLPSLVLDSKTYRILNKSGTKNPLDSKNVIIISYHYASRIAEQLQILHWDLIVFDEAHKLRNSYRTSNKMGQKLRNTFAPYKKLLLTATPLQNSLMELYGLSSLIDEQLFGDEKAFRQQFILTQDNLSALKRRIKGFVKRTLRKDVLEYVRYTRRQALTVPFCSSELEEQLYQGISTLLRREKSYALPANQRHLTGLILRKLLASSSKAVAHTLRTILERLKQLEFAATVPHCEGNRVFEGIIEDEEFSSEYLDELDDSGDENEDSIDLNLLRQEIQELEFNLQIAESIQIDSKTRALLIALAQGFDKLNQMGASPKVIIFTESKRTQDYLFYFLQANGYQNQIVSFSGTNSSPECTEIYKEWLSINIGTDKVTGSPQVDQRTAIIDRFRDSAKIMLATEAAAEGVNLQFCSLLINYDLPWNPQRLEQRIGRCHRYGQKYDVVVINFLNESNQADRRVLELLAQKFQLFDGVFGASDEVLGRIESGIDFEKRIESIYNNCRSPEEIDLAFAELQKELEGEIDQKMQETRLLLLENFDEDVHSVLKVQLNAAEERLDKLTHWFWKLTQSELTEVAQFSEQGYAFHLHSEYRGQAKGQYSLVRHNSASSVHQEANFHLYRMSHPLGQLILQTALQRELKPVKIRFDYSKYPAKISVLEELIDKTGYLSVHKVSIESLQRVEEHLILSNRTNEGVSIDCEISEKLLQLSGEVCEAIIDIPAEFQSHLESDFEYAKAQFERKTNQKNLEFFEQEVEKLDGWADDLKSGLEQSIKELDTQIKQARREAKTALSLEEKLEYQKVQRDLEKQRTKMRRHLFDKQDEIDTNRDILIEGLEGKMVKSVQFEHIFSLEWEIV